MQKTFYSQPTFRWQQQNEDHSLFCGDVLIAELRWDGREDGCEYYRIEHAAFPEALAEAGYGRWDGLPFKLKCQSFTEISGIVEIIYTAVFDQLDFIMAIE